MTVLQGWICVHQTHKAKSNEIAYSFVASRGFLVTARFSYYRYTRNYNIAMNLNHTYRTNETQTKLSRTKKQTKKRRADKQINTECSDSNAKGNWTNS